MKRMHYCKNSCVKNLISKNFIFLLGFASLGCGSHPETSKSHTFLEHQNFKNPKTLDDISQMSQALTSSEQVSFDDSIDWENRTQNYANPKPFSCETFIPSEFVKSFTDSLDIIAENCEKHNEVDRKNGKPSCDYNLCKQDFKPGGTPPPVVDFKVVVTLPIGKGGGASTSYGSSMGGLGGFGGGGSSSGSIVISLGINFTLGKKPDEYTCTNPYSVEIQKEIVKGALEFAKACNLPRPK